MEVPGQGISHQVRLSREVVEARDVAVETLVDSKKAKQEGGHRVCGRVALPLPEGSIQVVASAQDRPLADVKRLGEAIEVHQTPRHLQVRVGNSAVRVAGGHQGITHPLGPWMPPQDRLYRRDNATRVNVIARPPDASGTGARGVVVAFGDGPEGDHLREAGRPSVEVLDEPAEVVEGLVDPSPQGDAVTVLALGESMLESAE